MSFYPSNRRYVRTTNVELIFPTRSTRDWTTPIHHIPRGTEYYRSRREDRENDTAYVPNRYYSSLTQYRSNADYYRTLTVNDLLETTNKLKADYRGMLDRYNTVNMSTVAAVYGAPYHLVRHGLNHTEPYESQYYNLTRPTAYDYVKPAYEYDYGYERSGDEYKSSTGGPSKDRYSVDRKYGVSDSSPKSDGNEGLGRISSGIDNDIHEKTKYDSGIDSPVFSPVAEPELEPEPEPVPEPEPEPEICVYNEITAEEYKEIAEKLAVEDAKKKKSLFAFIPIAAVTQQIVQVDKVAVQFKNALDE